MAKKKKVVKLSKQRNKKLAKKIVKLIRIPIVIIAVLSALFLSARLLGNVAVSNVTDTLREIKTTFTKGEGYPYSLDAFGFREATAIGGKPLVISEDSTKVLSSSAAEIYSMQLGSGDSKVVSKNGRALIYSNTSNEVILQSRTEKLGSIKESGTVVAAQLSKNGCIATSYTSDEYQSVLSVYNRYFEKTFQWNCSQERISSIGLSKNGKSIAVAAVGTENAEIYTRLLIFNAGSSEPVADLMHRGTLFLNIIYTDSNKIIAVGDNKTVVLDKKGDTVDELVYSENSIISASSDDAGNTVICFEEFGGSKTAAVRFSKSGERTFTLSLDEKPECVAVNGSKTAAVNGDEIVIYSSRGEENKKIQTGHPAADIFWCSGTLYSVEGGQLCKY